MIEINKHEIFKVPGIMIIRGDKSLYWYKAQVRDHRTLCCPPPPFFFFFFFFNIDFFSYKQHFATFYVSLYDIYTKNTIKQ